VFTRNGFATLKREGLELSGTFIATLHAVLRPSGASVGPAFR
jgi:hypothetical protein